MIARFEFEDKGHKFSCATETPSHAGLQTWWWFSVDGETTTRYAPFEESPADTVQSVQERIISYYAELVAIRARPYRGREHFRKAQLES